MRKFYLAIARKHTLFIFFLSVFFSVLTGYNSFGQTQTYATPGTYTFTVPVGVTSMTVSTWGAGGAGGGVDGQTKAGGGGEGGSFVRGTITVVAGASYTVVVGDGGNGVLASGGGAGQASSFSVPAGATYFRAIGGAGGAVGNSFGAGGNATNAGNIVSGTTTSNFYGGNGGNATNASSASSGGGGGSAGAGGNGGAGGTITAGAAGLGSGTPTDVGVAGTVGRGSANDGSGNDATAPGAGGSGGRNANNNTDWRGGNGGDGRVIITYTQLTYKSQLVSYNLGSTTWCAGETRSVSITIKNIGTATWVDATGVDINVGLKWNTNGANWTDYYLRQDVGNVIPGGQKTYTFSITASNNIGAGYTTPLAAGTNNLIFDIVYEGVSWFGDNGGGIGPGNAKFTSAAQTISNPAAPTGTATQSFCAINAPTVANLGATLIAGHTVKWYSTATGGTALATTTALINGTHYYASQTNATGCEGYNRFDVTATIANPLAPTATTPQNFCAISNLTVASLTATGSTIKWYAASSGGAALVSTTVLTNGTHYYASQTVSGCESATRMDVTVNLTDPAAPTGSANQLFCTINSPKVSNLVATGSTIKWYTAATGGTLLTAATALTNGTHYYASQTVGGCESTTRLDVTVTIDNIAAPTGSASQAFCSINTPTLADMVVVGTTIKWYTAATLGTLLPSTTALVNGTHYFASQSDADCESATRLDVTAVVSDPVAPTGVVSQIFCSDASPTVADLTATGSSIQWYAAATGGTALATTTSLVNGTHYYASQTVGLCESDTRLDVTAVVNTAVSIITNPGPLTQTICATSNVSYSVVAQGTGLTYQWLRDGNPISNGGRISGATTSILTITGATLADNGTYSVSVSGASPCTSVISDTANLDVNQKIAITSQPLTPQTICEGQPYTISVNTTGTVLTYDWYKNGSFFAAATFDGLNTYSLTIPAVTVADNGSTYRLLLDDGTGIGCTSTNSNVAALTVRPTPTATISGTTTVCEGSTAPLITFTNPQSLPVVVTYDINGAGTFTVVVAANSTSTVAAPTGTPGTFDYNDVSVAYQTGPGCSNLITGTATITVSPLPDAIATPATQPACSADAITTIVLSSGVTGTTYTWTRNNTATVTGIAASGNGDIIGTLTNTTNAAITVTFTITPTAATCVGTPITASVIVNPKPSVTPKTATICSDGSFSVTPTNGAGNIVPTGTTYSWSAPSVTGGVTGGASGSTASSITGTLSNPTNTVQTATYTVTPLSGSCSGANFTVTVTLNPKPFVTPQTPATCSAAGFTVAPTNGAGNIVPAGTTYSWSAPTVTGGLTGGAGGTNAASISGTLTNPTNTAQTATYTVTPLTGSCPGSSFTVIVTVNPKPTITAKTATVCNANAFSVVSVNAPAANIVPAGTTYSWSSPTVTGGLTGGTAGTNSADISGTLVNPTNSNQTATYIVTPLSGGCTGATFTVTVTVTPEPFVTPKTAAACSASGFAVTPTNGAGNIVPSGTTYTWSAPSVTGGLTGGAAGTNATSITGTLTNPTSSVQTATYTVTPKSGTCIGANFTVTVTVNPKPFVTPQTAATCSASGFTETPTDGGGNIIPVVTTYSWPVPVVTGGLTGGATGSNASIISGILINPTNIAQTATYTVTPSSGGCAGPSFTEIVTVSPKPAITAKTATVCNEDLFTVTPVNNVPAGNIVPAGTTYSWPAPVVTGGMTGGASGTNAASITGTLTNPGNTAQTATYTVTPTSGGCVGSTFTVTVTVSPEPFATAKTATVCSASGFNVTITNGGGNIIPSGTTYSWSAPTVTGGLTGGTTGTNASSISGSLTNPTTAVQTATYTVTPKSGSCTGLTFTVTVTVNPKPTAGAITGPTTVCIGSTINLASNASGIGTLTYTWNSSSTSRATVNGAGVVTGVSPGTTNITYTVTDGNGCVQTSANFVVTITKPTANAITQASGLDEVCINSTLPLTANATGVGTLTYTWASSNTGRATVTNTGIVTGVSAGAVNITYTVTDANGCSTTSAPFAVTVNAIPTGALVATENSGNANNDNIICTGSSVTFTAPGGYGSYIFKINGTSVQTGTNNIYSSTTLVTGQTVTVDIANALNCGATLTALPITVNPLPVAGINPSKTSSCPDEEVIFTATPAGATNYTFKVDGVSQQSGPSNTFSTTTLTNGNSVTVDVKNANGCIATSTAVVITVGTLPVLTSFTASNSSICTGDNVTFTASSAITYANYDFKVNGTSVQSGTSNIFNSTTLTNGSIVTVEVTTAAGCPKTFGPLPINVSNLPAGALSATENSGTANDNSICAGTNISFLATAGFSSYDFQVDGVSKQLGASNTFNTTTLTNGQVVTVIVKNSATCTSTFGSITVTVIAAPAGTLAIFPSNTICLGDNVDFTATAGFDNYEFKINGVTAQNGSGSTFSTVDLVNGDVVTVEVTNTASCSTIFNSFTMAVNALPSGTLAIAETSGNTPNDGIICTGAAVVFTAPAGFTSYNFLLNGSSIQNNGTRTFTTTTLVNGDKVTVAMGNASSCVALLNEYTITVNAYPVVAPVTGTLSVCVTGTTTLASTTTGGVWSSLNTSIATINATGTVTGVAAGTATINYTVTNANGCATIVSATVTVNALPVVTAISGAASVCVGSTTPFTTPTTGGTWDTDDAAIATVSATGVVTGVAAGTATISYTVINASSCTTVVTKNIIVNALPVVAAITGTTSVCFNSTTDLDNATAGGTWSSSDIAVATVNAAGLVTGVDAGTATISYSVTNGSGCNTTVTTVVTVNALPVPTLNGPNPICLGSIGNVYTTETGGGIHDYVWNVVNGSVSSGGTSTDNTVTVSWLAPGAKSINVNYTDANGCVGAASATVANAPGSSPTITGPALVCQNVAGNIYTTETGKIDYTWTINGGTATAGGTATDNTVTITWNTTGTRSVTVNYSDVGGCDAATPTVKNVTVNPQPTVVITDPVAVCSPATVNLTAAAIKTGSTAGLTYTYWEDAAATISYTSASAATAGTYYIKGTTAAGCFDIQPVTVTVNPSPTVVTTAPAALCAPATIDLTDAAITTGSTAGLTFTYWTNAAATAAYGTPATAGAGTYFIKGTLPSGCFDIQPITISINPLPTVVTNNPTPVCAPATVDLTLPAVTAGSTAGLTLSYWTDAAATIAYTTPTAATGGTYYIKGETAAGCVDIKPVTVTSNATPTVVITNPAAACSPGTADLTAPAVTAGSSAGLTYTYWTNAAATASYGTPGAATAGTYYIKGTAVGGCFEIKPVTVTVNPSPTVVITNPAGICAPGTVNLTLASVTAGSTAGLTYSYFTDAAATTSYTTPLTAAAGTYYIKGTITATGCFDIKPVIVTVNPKPTVTVTNPAAVCSPATVNITLAAVTAGSTTGLTFTYWTNAAATTSYTTPTAATAGTYYIKGTVTATGCFDIKPVVVTVNAPPAVFVVTPGNTTICFGSIQSLSASTGAPTAGSQTASGTSFNVSDYNFISGVSGKASNTATMPVLPVGALITKVTISFNINHSYEGDLIVNIKAPNGNVLNLVNRKGGSGDNFVNVNINNTSVAPVAGSNPITGTFTPDAAVGIGAPNASNVNNFNSLISTPNGGWVLGVEDRAYHFGSGGGGTITSWSVKIDYTVSTAVNVVWSPTTALFTDPEATIAYTGTQLGTVYANPTGTTTYTATATNAAGCSTAKTVTLTVNPIPVVTVSSDYCVAGAGKVRLTANSPTATSYIWSTGATTQSIDVDVSGFYEVSGYVTPGGCPGKAVVNIATELVTNGDFENGDADFNTDYTTHTGSFYNGTGGSGLYPEGYYAVDTSAFSPSNGIGYHDNFHGKDHTTGHGNMMMVNGSNVLYTIWEQTVPVLPNTPYYFSAWAMNLNPGSPARLRFEVNGVQVGTIADLNTAPKPTTEGALSPSNWIRFYSNPTWTSGPTTTSAVIRIINLNTVAGGNDFAIDDISFGTLSTFIRLESAAGTDAQTACKGTAITDIVYNVGNGNAGGPTVTGLPAGVTSTFAGDKLTISGIPTTVNNYTYTVTTTGCNPVSVTGTVNVQGQVITLSSGTASPSVCINSAVSIGFTLSGTATGATVSGLPPTITGSLSGLTYTLSGTPTALASYPYTITTTGTCNPETFTGTIKVQSQTITLETGSNDGQTVCINQNILNIRYDLGGTATGVASVSGLPLGVSYSYNTGVLLINGSPTQSGPFTYTITTSGLCTPTTATGTITVTPAATLTLTSGVNTDAQSACINTAITNITYAVGGGTNASVSGLPATFTGTFSGGVFTISGTPTVAGLLNYTITTTGGCGVATTTGTINVQSQTVGLTSGTASPTPCINTAMANIVYTVAGTATSGTVSGLPSGVSFTVVGKVITISGTPTVSGPFAYTVTTSGPSCTPATIGGTINVQAAATGGTLTSATTCGGANGTLTLSGQVGTITRWEVSTNGGTSWSPITNTTISLPYTNITVPTLYRVVVSNGCGPVFSTVATITLHNYWVGGTSSDWNTASNWSDNALPSVSCADVTIPAVTSPNVYPILSSGTSTITNLVIKPTATVTVTGGTLQIGGSITNGGSFDVSNGTLVFNGNATQNVAGTMFVGNTIQNLTVSNPSTGGVVVAGTPGQPLNISGTLAFGTSNGTLNTGDNLVLTSTAAGTARVADITNGGANTGNKFTGLVTVQRYFPARRAWRLFTTPVSAGGSVFDTWQNGGVFAPGKGTYVTGPTATSPTGPDGLDWSPLNNSSLKSTASITAVPNTHLAKLSRNVADTSDNIPYFIFVRGDRLPSNTNIYNSNITTLSGKGKLQTGRQTFPSNNTALEFTFIGNPYASPVDFNKIVRTNIPNRFWLWDPYINSEQGAYVVLEDPTNSGTYTATPPTSMSEIALQSGQAFYVQTGVNGPATVVFGETAKSATSNAATFRPLGKVPSSIRANLYHLNADEKTILLDGILAQFNEQFSKEVDLLDAVKATNIKENLSLKRDGKTLSVERRPAPTSEDTLYLQLSRTTQRDYRFTFEPAALEASLTAILEDSYTGKKTSLSVTGNSNYDFAITGDAASAVANRFRIVFKLAPPIPITHNTIKAYQLAANIAVEWNVENEKNISKYEVEKSADGTTFVKVNTTTATGADLPAVKYSWLDANPWSGDNFYRVRRISPSGTSEYSSVVSVKMGLVSAGIRIYPNPVTDGIIGAEFKNMAAGVYGVRLLNSPGQTVLNKIISHAPGTSMEYIQPDYKLASGIYQLEVTAPDKKVTKVKVIIK